MRGFKLTSSPILVQVVDFEFKLFSSPHAARISKNKRVMCVTLTSLSSEPSRPGVPLFLVVLG